MPLRRTLLKGGALLGLGQGTTAGLRFVRSVIIAHLVSPEDFGIGATFGLTILFLDMATNLGVDSFVIQAPDGDREDVQAGLHGLQILRGVILGGILLGFARPFAWFFGVAHAEWAFRWLALVPVMKGLVHIDYIRAQRQMSFAPTVTMQIVTQTVVTAAAIPLVLLLRSFSVFLWLGLAEVLTTSAFSHLFCQRRFLVVWNPRLIVRLFSFGWPVLADAWLVFLMFQGDRLIISRWYSMAELGLFSVAFALVAMPLTFLSSIANALLLPFLSQVKSSHVDFDGRYGQCAQAMALVSGVAGVGLIMLGGPLVVLVFGVKYAAASAIIPWLAAVQALRFMRVGPTIAAIAQGNTRIPLVANIVRCTSFALALWAAVQGADVRWVVAAGLVGEFLGFLVCLVMLRSRRGIRVTTGLLPFLASLGILASSGLALFSIGTSDAWLPRAGLAAILLIAFLVAMALAWPVLRKEAHLILTKCQRIAIRLGGVPTVGTD